MIKYEFMKLYKNRIFLFFGLILIVSNLIFLYLHEKDTTDFQYIYKQKSEYEAFQNGNEDVMQYSYYKSIEENENTYIESYPEFLSEMDDRAEGMKKLVIYSDTDSFVYRNIQKTCDDFEKLEGIELSAGNSYGIKHLAKYNWGILFSILFLIICEYYLFYYERNMGLFLLLKGTKYGHGKLVMSKWLVIMTSIILYEIIQETSTIFLMGYFYGYGDLYRNIQSILEFRNCMYVLSVSNVLVLTVIIRIVFMLVIANVMFLVSICIRSEVISFLTMGTVLGIEYMWADKILASSSFAVLKCVNPFYLRNIQNTLGNYQNLNFFEYAVGKNLASIVCGIIISISAIALGVRVFHTRCQIRSEGIFEKMKAWVRKKCSFLSRHTVLFFFESYKIMIQQKKGILLIVLVVFCIIGVKDVTGVHYYMSAEDAVYHSYMSEISGKVTDERLEYIDGKVNYLEQLREKIDEVGKDDTIQGAEVLISYYANEIDLLRNGVMLLVNQAEALKSKSGNIYDKYFIDEKEYIAAWKDVKEDLFYWSVGAIGVILWTAGIYPMEEKKKILPLLHTTKNGKRVLNRKKNWCAVTGTICIVILTQLPVLMSFYEIDQFRAIWQKLSDFTMLYTESQITVVMVLLFAFFLKGLSLLLVMTVTIYLSRITKSEMITDIIGIGSIILVVILCYYLKMDIFHMLLGKKLYI